jgi:hypothetical protein
MERLSKTNSKGGLNWYIDGSKTNKGTGVGEYGCDTRWKLRFLLWTILQNSRQKCMPSRYAWLRIQKGAIGIGTFPFSQPSCYYSFDKHHHLKTHLGLLSVPHAAGQI